MGVPALFRWLSRKYPKIISPVVEGDTNIEIGAAQYSDPNPNGEVDNLYLDMNGIVHPCSHPEHKPPPETEDEMFLDIFKYTDRVLMMARPRKVLVIAIDGVAPRAKMNQQRSRRFRSAQDAKIMQEERNNKIIELEARGEMIEDAIKGKKSWDTNSITPGTPFMDKLAEALRYWVAYKLSNDPGWENLQVILSDSSVPGEGEHKLMSFIRSQRQDPEYDPNTKHCIYGLDADLIFLGLATHEPHFRVLREDVFAQSRRPLRVADNLQMTQAQKDLIQEQDDKKPFLWLHVNVLREYLVLELYDPKLPFQFDLERAIDDWVFMCFFVGNDFLPHLPSLDVRDNGIDVLVDCWKKLLPRLKDYITCDGVLNISSVEMLMEKLASKEDDIFKKRKEMEVRREENAKRRRIAQEEEKALKRQYLPTVSKGKDKAPLLADQSMPLMDTNGNVVDGFAHLSNKDIVQNRDVITNANLANQDAAETLKKLIMSKNSANDVNISASSAVSEIAQTNCESPGTKRSSDPTDSSSDITEDNSGDVRMWETGYKERYYSSKFNVTSDEEILKIKKDMVRCYLEGISWVLLYYYQGCPSWLWYYPYHYSPFASDFKDVKELIGGNEVSFSVGEPFKPYEQLMSVLPAASAHNLPEVFRDLMCNPESEIIDFYPEDFKIDMNGAKMSWLGIALLPFIDEKRLLKAVTKKYHLLTDREKERNTLKEELLFVSNKNRNFHFFHDSLYEKGVDVCEFKSSKTGLCGNVKRVDIFGTSGETPFPLSQGEMPNLDNSEFLCLTYSSQEKNKGKSMLLNGYIPHNLALSISDKNAVLYGSGRQYNRFHSTDDNRGYINTGPSGKEDFLMYSMRRGGYRSTLEYFKQETRGVNNTSMSNYNKPYLNQNQGYGRGDNYQNGYNSGYNNGNTNRYNSGYNNSGNYYQKNRYNQHQYDNRAGSNSYNYSGNQAYTQNYSSYNSQNPHNKSERFPNPYSRKRNPSDGQGQRYRDNRY